MGAWDKFFCSSCQLERSAATAIKLPHRNNNRICAECHAKSAPRQYERKKRVRDFVDEYEPPAIPADVLDAYRESTTD
jgi:NMD protein affecting ribosome stability and mRNA decay